MIFTYLIATQRGDIVSYMGVKYLISPDKAYLSNIVIELAADKGWIVQQMHQRVHARAPAMAPRVYY